MITYSQIFTRFMTNKIDDPKFFSYPDSVAYEMMNEWLTAVFAKPFIQKLFDTFETDENLMQIEYELKYKSSQFQDDSFVIELLATGMYINYLTPQVNSTLHTMQMFGGKEEKFYSQAAHLEILEEKLKRAELDLRKLVRDRNYVNIVGGDDNW